jgi:hypothetical protein
MSVIATLITRHYTVHATDSFLTLLEPHGNRQVVEKQKTKIVRVPAWRGAMAYWGLARQEPGWNTMNWLRQRAQQVSEFASAKKFASQLGEDLTRKINGRHFERPLDKGFGIHFTAYENVDGYWIPELFLISNWSNPSYNAVRAKITVSRETYGTLFKITDRPTEHGNAQCRLKVRESLHNGNFLLFNNGDPVLFKPIADAIMGTFKQLWSRKQLRDASDAKTHLDLARRPVEVVSKLLADFTAPGTRVVGGKPHDLAIAPNGETESSTGD